MLGLIILTSVVVNGWYLIEAYILSRRLAKSGQRIGNATITGNLSSNSDRRSLMKLFFGGAKIEPAPPTHSAALIRIRCLLATSTMLVCAAVYIVLNDPSR